MPANRVTLLYNPGAGDDMQPTAGQLRALIKEEGYKIHLQSTKEKNWQDALSRATDLFVVAGGDGTVTNVARRLVGRNTPIAVLPLGTANNISKTLGIVDLPVTYLIPSWKKAKRVCFDAGVARGPWGEQYFIEGAGAGLLTSSMPRISKSKTLAQLRAADVKVTYAQQLFRDHLIDEPAMQISARLDGEDVSGEYLLLEVMNIQYIGPNLLLAPNVKYDSGKFEIIFVSEKHRNKLRKHIKQWQDGKSVPPEFITRRGRHLTIQWTDFKLHLDDKVISKQEQKYSKLPITLEFEVVPEALNFLVPKEVYKRQELARKNALKAEKSKDGKNKVGK